MSVTAPIEAILHEIAARYRRVRSGLGVGFGDERVAGALRDFRGGVWHSCGAGEELPFEDAQFEVVVVNGAVISRELVREVNRVLLAEGCMFFTVPERTSKQPGYTEPDIYRLVREGFSIVAARRPKWWFFGRKGSTITICAQKKVWREHTSLVRPGAFSLSPLRTRK